jgi:phage N-6-adenine-methyltransferase
MTSPHNPAYQDKRCRHCKATFQPRSAAGRPQVYCSKGCREAAARRRKRQPVYFSGETPEWATPQDLFDQLNARYGFGLDVCATAENAKCPRFFTRADNALMQTWDGVCWMNPPYGREIGLWVAKAHDSARAGATVVCLLPVRSDTVWWQRFVDPDGDVEFIKGRLRFGGAAAGAPFPSAVVVFHCGLHCGATDNETRNEMRSA